MDRRFDALQYSLLYAVLGLFGTMVATLVAVAIVSAS